MKIGCVPGLSSPVRYKLRRMRVYTCPQLFALLAASTINRNQVAIIGQLMAVG